MALLPVRVLRAVDRELFIGEAVVDFRSLYDPRDVAPSLFQCLVRSQVEPDLVESLRSKALSKLHLCVDRHP